MKKVYSTSQLWKAIDILFPKHLMPRITGHEKTTCSDGNPGGWGIYGCERCYAIRSLEMRGIKIYPREKRSRVKRNKLVESKVFGLPPRVFKCPLHTPLKVTKTAVCTCVRTNKK